MLEHLYIPFGPWLPDQPDSGGCNEATGVMPADNQESYASFPSLQQVNNNSGMELLGVFTGTDSDGSIRTYVGGPQDLLELLAAGDALRNPGGGASYYTATTRWKFAQFGDRVIAVSPTNAPQYIDMGDTAFADLPGSPPVAAEIAVVRDFVVLGNLQGSPAHPDWVQWSAYYNSEIWDIGNRAAQSDFQQIQSGNGKIQRIIGGARGVIFRERGIVTMDYVGGPTVFAFNTVTSTLGTPSGDSVVDTGDAIFFYGTDGFYSLGRGGLVRIGAGKVDRWFRANVSDPSTVCGGYVSESHLVMWSFAPKSSTSAYWTLVYNTVSERWSLVKEGGKFMGQFTQPSVTLDDLDAFMADSLIDGSANANIPADTTAYLGSSAFPQLVVFGGGLEGIYSFSGGPQPSRIVTRELSLQASQRMAVTGVRAFIDEAYSGDVFPVVSVGARDRVSDSVEYSATATEGVDGLVPFRVEGRNLRVVVQVDSSGFDNARGVEVRFRRAGKR